MYASINENSFTHMIVLSCPDTLLIILFDTWGFTGSSSSSPIFSLAAIKSKYPEALSSSQMSASPMRPVVPLMNRSMPSMSGAPASSDLGKINSQRVFQGDRPVRLKLISRWAVAVLHPPTVGISLLQTKADAPTSWAPRGGQLDSADPYL